MAECSSYSGIVEKVLPPALRGDVQNKRKEQCSSKVKRKKKKRLHIQILPIPRHQGRVSEQTLEDKEKAPGCVALLGEKNLAVEGSSRSSNVTEERDSLHEETSERKRWAANLAYPSRKGKG